MSTVVQIPKDVAPQVVTFKQPRMSFTLHNARSKSIDRMFNGNRFTIPAVHEVGDHADTDSDGDPIPGTCVIEDEFLPTSDGGEEMNLSAVKAVQFILGITPTADGGAVATSRAAVGGLSLLPRHSPKSQWKAIAVDGEKRAFAVQVDNARTYIKHWDESNAKRVSLGVGALTPDEGYREAAALLNEYNKLMKVTAVETLAPHQADALREEVEMNADVEALAMELAEKAAKDKDIDKMALFEKLVKDPKVRLLAQQKGYRIRKRGYKAPDTAELKAAAAAAKAVADAEKAKEEEEEEGEE